MKTCESCGQQIEDNTAACPGCGAFAAEPPAVDAPVDGAPAAEAVPTLSTPEGGAPAPVQGEPMGAPPPPEGQPPQDMPPQAAAPYPQQPAQPLPQQGQSPNWQPQPSKAQQVGNKAGAAVGKAGHAVADFFKGAGKSVASAVKGGNGQSQAPQGTAPAAPVPMGAPVPPNGQPPQGMPPPQNGQPPQGAPYPQQPAPPMQGRPPMPPQGVAPQPGMPPPQQPAPPQGMGYPQQPPMQGQGMPLPQNGPPPQGMPPQGAPYPQQPAPPPMQGRPPMGPPPQGMPPQGAPYPPQPMPPMQGRPPMGPPPGAAPMPYSNQMAGQYGSSRSDDVGMNGFQARTWTGGTITTPNGISEPVVMQCKAQFSSSHTVSLQDGNFVLTPTRIIWYKHGGAKKFLLGDFAHLTQGTYDFEFPLAYIHSIEVDSLGLWKYDNAYTYDGEKYSFCFNALNHDNFLNKIPSLIPGLLIEPNLIKITYYPNISPLDPRNPIGVRYNPAWPRSYVVAHNNDPASMEAAVADAKKAGILAADYQLPDVPLEQLVLPQGIPTVVHYFKAFTEVEGSYR